VDYARRFGIEEGFRDEKSGGCELEASRIRDAKKLERFLLVVSTALIVGVSEGIAAAQAGRREEVDPHRLRSLSYFQLGLRRILLCVLHGEKKLFCCCLLKPMSDPLPVVATRKEFHRRRKMKYPAYLFKTVEFFPLTR
jgi:hypothetical protein